jgi:hypothetical protein
MSFEEHAVVQESLSRVHPRARASWLRARGLDDSYYTTFHRPESTNGLKCIGRWPWGPSWELAGRDTFLYLGSGSGVRILSIADSVHPRMLGQINARGLVSQVVAQDSLLFVACGSWGAQIYSVADPASPRELGSMDAVIGDLAVEDSFCYTAGDDSFRIYNIADASQARQVAVVCDSGGVIVEEDGYAYVGHGSSGSGLNVYDARNPHSPTLVNSLGGVQLAMFIRGQRLFRTSVQPSYLQILDVTNPSSISQVGRIDGYGGIGLYADDYFAYLSCAYDHDGLFVIDITNPATPQLRDSLDPEGAEEWETYVPRSPGYGYLADAHGGLVTVDLHNVDSISEAWSGYKADQAVDIHVDGGVAYVANNLSGLQLVDVADPTNPVSLGIVDFVGAKVTSTATAQDSFAFMSMTGIAGRRYLRVVDVLDPTNPQIVAQESCYNPPQDYVLKDSLLYAAEENQFQVFNVARPREPVLVGSCGGDGVAVVVQDSFAYTAAGAIRVTNIARPDSPFVVSTVSGHSATGLAVQDSFLYVPYVYDTLLTYSIADPSHPRLVSAVQTGVWPWDVVLGVSRAYVALSDGWGIEVFDLANPGLPVRRGRCGATGDVRRLCYSNGLVYAAMWEAGVAIYETTGVGICERPDASIRPTALRVWPSVAGDEVRFTLGATALATDIAVFDVSGKRLNNVRQQTLTKGGAADGLLDLSGLAAGVYVVRVGSEGRIFTAKVVKANRR